jgi:hypothetical protein
MTTYDIKAPGGAQPSKPTTVYDALMAAARKADAANDGPGAKRLLELAKEAQQGGLGPERLAEIATLKREGVLQFGATESDAERRQRLQRMQATARAGQDEIQGAYENLKPLVESGRATPEQKRAFEVLGRHGGGFFTNPYTGQMTSRELLANNMRPNAAQSFVGGTERGALYAGNDELAGGVNAAVPGPGTMGERARFATERSRAEHEANMRDNPIATTVGEVVGGVATGGRAIDAARQGVSRAAQPLANFAGRNFATRAATGAAIGGADAATYGFMAGEDGNRFNTAIDAGKWGAGMGAAGSLGVDAISAYLANRTTKKATDRMVANTPTSDELRTDAGALFDEAVRTGGTANQSQTAKLAADFRDTLTREGLIGPDGKMVTSYPKVSDAFRQIEAYGRQSMSPAQMRTVRRLLQNAAQSQDKSEARMGSILLDQFDGFATEFMPQIPQANDLYTKASRGDLIDEAIELAGNRAGAYSGSGFENALRTEFRRLNRDIIKGRLKGLSPDQVSMIAKIAKGGPMENLMRDVGRMAPTSVMNATMTGGAPVMVGSMLGSPGLGVAAGVGALGAGAVGRNIATKMQGRNADIVSALMRGGEMPTALPANPAVRRIAEELLRKNINAAAAQ